jgi:hypothetical protein
VLDEQQILSELLASASNFRAALTERTPEARRVIQTLVQDRMGFSPFVDDGVRGCESVGTGTYGGLLAGDRCPTSTGGPNGIRTRVFSPPRAFVMAKGYR